MAKRLPPAEYRRRMELIKPYVNFNFKGGTKRTKSIISRYYKELSPRIDAGDKPYLPRDKSAKNLVSETFDIKTTRRLKRIPIPAEVEKVTVKRHKLTYERAGVRTTAVKINRRKFAEDTEKYIDRLTKRLGGNRFIIRAGKYQIPGTYGADEVKAAVLGLQRKYGNWKEWLNIEAADYGDDEFIDEES